MAEPAIKETENNDDPGAGSLLGKPDINAALNNPTPLPDPAPKNPDVTSKPISDDKLPDWKAALPDDIKNDPSMKTVVSIEGLAKSFVHSQKMVGADKIVVPGKHATEEDWHNFYRKTGKPDTVEGYELKTVDDVDKNMFGAFKKASFDLHLTSPQAQGIMNWFNQFSQDLVTQQATTVKEANEKGLEGLRKEWGPGFDSQLARARLAILEYADDETIAYLKQSGLAEDPKLVRLFAAVGKTFDEDKIIGHSDGPLGVTPAEAAQKVASMRGDKNNPIYIKNHPNHKAAVEEMSALDAIAAGKKRR